MAIQFSKKLSHQPHSLGSLLQHLNARRPQIEHWLANQWQGMANFTPIYGSVDLRCSGHKLAPVDANLYPGGFNNLALGHHVAAVAAFKTYIKQHIAPRLNHSKPPSLLLLAESHTRNMGYLDNIATLQRLLQSAGAQVHIGALGFVDDFQATTVSGEPLHIHALEQSQQKVQLKTAPSSHIDAIALNNDLSAGMPPLLTGLDGSQLISPSPLLGWYQRRKSQHFSLYQKIAQQFADAIGFDAWQITPSHRQKNNMSFDASEGEHWAELKTTTDEVFAEINEAYRQRNIATQPFVIIKADAGTYGMGIMSIQHSESLLQMNRKNRNKMAVIKDGQQVSEVIIQEGVASILQWQGATAEPTLYLVGQQVVGGFYRYNAERSDQENLNAKGMAFGEMSPNASSEFDFACGVVAQLSHLAMAQEIADATNAASQASTSSASN